MKTSTKLTAACLLAFAASASQAAVVDSWVYDINMEWVTTGPKAPVFSDGTGGLEKVTSTVLSWGSALNPGWERDTWIPDSVNPTTIAQARSSLIIEQPNGTGTIGTGAASAQNVNMFAHYNNELNPNTPKLESAVLKVSVDLAPSDNAYASQTLTKEFRLFFYETPNVGGRVDDILAFVLLPEISDTFTYDGQQYQFNYFQTSGPNALTQFDAATCSLASGGALTSSCYGFTTPESAKTSLEFGITIAAVPEPETYAMLLAGLGMIGIVARRRRNAIHS